MENIVNKLKSYFTSNFGKLAIGVSGLSFIITLMLSVLLKNRIDISVFKALISAIITMIILYALNIFLTKYLGDIIEDSDVEIISNVSDDSLNNIPNNSSQEESDNLQNLNNADNDILAETKSENGIDSIVGDIPSPKETIKNDFTIDKNNKVDYDNLRGDIGDIILGASSYKSSSDISDSSDYYGGDKKINERVMEREVMEDPEKAASAIRTVIAKDKGK